MPYSIRSGGTISMNYICDGPISPNGDWQARQIGAEWMTSLKRMKEALEAIRDYPQNGDRRTDDGYPDEIQYDEYAYRRLVDSYRAAAEAGLSTE